MGMAGTHTTHRYNDAWMYTLSAKHRQTDSRNERLVQIEGQKRHDESRQDWESVYARTSYSIQGS